MIFQETKIKVICKYGLRDCVVGGECFIARCCRLQLGTEDREREDVCLELSHVIGYVSVARILIRLFRELFSP